MIGFEMNSNRMASACYLPPPVKAGGGIPKQAGGTRTLGVRMVRRRLNVADILGGGHLACGRQGLIGDTGVGPWGGRVYPQVARAPRDDEMPGRAVAALRHAVHPAALPIPPRHPFRREGSRQRGV